MDFSVSGCDKRRLLSIISMTCRHKGVFYETVKNVFGYSSANTAMPPLFESFDRACENQLSSRFTPVFQFTGKIYGTYYSGYTYQRWNHPHDVEHYGDR
jgi:hypothetical protein